MSKPQGSPATRLPFGGVRKWFQKVVFGAPATFKGLPGLTLSKPALNLSTPMKMAFEQIFGIAAVAEIDRALPGLEILIQQTSSPDRVDH